MNSIVWIIVMTCYDTLFNAVAIRRSVSRSQLSYISRIKSQATEGMASWSFLGPLGPLGCLSPELQRCCVSIASSRRQARGCVGSLGSISWGKRSSLLQENYLWSRLSFKELGYCAAESRQLFLPLSTLWQATRTIQWQSQPSRFRQLKRLCSSFSCFPPGRGRCLTMFITSRLSDCQNTHISQSLNPATTARCSSSFLCNCADFSFMLTNFVCCYSCFLTAIAGSCWSPGLPCGSTKEPGARFFTGAGLVSTRWTFLKDCPEDRSRKIWNGSVI